ncbi:hypothetical protein KP509_31G068900 [Ceratopteris richardii]|uniref:Uncharacterized protein n=1 Tax=Ceratopteris richardii TaxID=49495 RepID=A0A8T2QYT5_CERRI|nr:hypothetical protein KP509_31G068900 [Ceratopteris richardii]
MDRVVNSRMASTETSSSPPDQRETEDASSLYRLCAPRLEGYSRHILTQSCVPSIASFSTPTATKMRRHAVPPLTNVGYPGTHWHFLQTLQACADSATGSSPLMYGITTRPDAPTPMSITDNRSWRNISITIEKIKLKEANCAHDMAHLPRNVICCKDLLTNYANDDVLIYTYGDDVLLLHLTMANQFAYERSKPASALLRLIQGLSMLQTTLAIYITIAALLRLLIQPDLLSVLLLHQLYEPFDTGNHNIMFLHLSPCGGVII